MNKTITLLFIGVIFLALLLMVLNSFRTEERQGLSVPAPEKTRPQESIPLAHVPEAKRIAQSRADARESVPPARVPEAGGGTPAPASATLEVQNRATAPLVPQAMPHQVESAVPPPSAEGVTVKTVPAQIDAGQSASPPPDAPPRLAPSRPTTVPDPGAQQPNGNAKNITSIVVYATQEGATLRLGGDKPLVYTSMLLRDPDRFVLDFAGHWNVNIPGVPPNKLIKAIRIGRQADSTRIAVDLHRAPASYRLIKTSPLGLDVRLR